MTRPCANTCGRTIRPHHTTKDQFPGTVAEKARGLCTTCHRNAPTVRQPAPTFCRGCRAIFRPNGTTAREYWGTVHHAGRGYCSTCYTIATETGALEVDEAEARQFDLAQARAALACWIADRNRRLAAA